MRSPLVSVIIPCYNEEATICGVLNAIRDQTLSVSDVEVVIADGNSTDRTREKINEFKKTHPELPIKLVENTKRIIPAALNLGLANAAGEYIVRMDGHTIPAADYLEKCVLALKAGKGENVGGVLEVKPGRNTWIARSIAMAAVHPLGVGDALYRRATVATEADTVAFGSFRRSLVERIGYFDETLPVNEDYEFNTRIRASGGKIWIDPSIKAAYYSRPDLKSLARQYFSYGYWKFKMLQRYPGTIRWRQALPPIFVFGILMLLLLSVFWNLSRLALAAAIISYWVILIVGSIKPAIKTKQPMSVIGIPLAIATMHVSWGSGFWWSLLKRVFTEKQNGR